MSVVGWYQAVPCTALHRRSKALQTAWDIVVVPLLRCGPVLCRPWHWARNMGHTDVMAFLEKASRLCCRPLCCAKAALLECMSHDASIARLDLAHAIRPAC